MKFDLHCHTKEGSLDGKVGIDEYIRTLKEKGFSGMLVTDHNSYKGYRYWEQESNKKELEDFIVLKGIEYDTSNAGHMLVIIPEDVNPRVLEVRGMPVAVLIKVVHAYGGIIGPAHPFGEKYMSFANTKAYHCDKDRLMQKFDFVETFNSCEPLESNRKAKELAKKYGLSGFGGSDAHRIACVGTAYAEFTEEIKRESDLIALVKEKTPIATGGVYYHGTTKERIGKVNNILVYSFWIYNKAAGLFRMHKRHKWAKDVVFTE